MKTGISFAALTLFSLALARPVAAQLPHYTLSDLGAIPAAPYPAAIADVTRTGFAVSNYTDYPGQPANPEMYHSYAAVSRNGAIQSTLNLGIANQGFAKKINDKGSVIGNNGSNEEYITMAFGPNITYAAQAVATGINSRDQVIGYIAETKYTARWSTDLWSPPGAPGSGGSLGLPGDTDAEANAISENGLAAGASGSGFIHQYNPYYMTPVVKHAFVWTPTTPNGLTGTSRALPPLNAGDNAEAFAVNDLGEAAGTSNYAAVYWRATGAAAVIPLYAVSINNKSQIFDGSKLWTAGGGLQYPATLITNPAGWTGLKLFKLYNDGALVGTGQFGGATHIFLLAPVPVTLSGKVTLEQAFNPAQAVTFTLRPTNGAPATTLTQTLGADGSFTLSNISPDNYTVLIHADHYLQKSVPGFRHHRKRQQYRRVSTGG